MKRSNLKLCLCLAAVVLVMVGCEESKDPAAGPPPQPQPPAEVVSFDEPAPTADRLLFSSGADEPDLELYSTFRNGSGRNRLTRNLNGDSGVTAYPDSGLVYYVCQRSETICVATSSGTGTAPVFTTQRIDYALIEDPAISPDGTRMIFTGIHISPDGQSTNYDLYLYNFETEEITNFAVGAAKDQMATWASNTDVVWSRFREGDWELVTFKIGSPAGSLPKLLTDNAVDDLGVDASPDGTKLSWIRITGNDGEVVTMPFTGSVGTPTVLAPVHLERGFIGGDPDTAWSPDGTAIAFAGIPQGEQDVEIFTVPAAGGTATNVTKNDVYDVDPEWALLPPSFTVSAPSSFTEGSSPTVTFTIALDAPQQQGLSVNYQTVAGTASAGTDYVTKSGTATFAAGVSKVEVKVQVTDDAVLEPLETFKLVLNNASAGTYVAVEEAVARIKDNEVEPSPTPSVAPSPSVTPPSGGEELIAYQTPEGIWKVSPTGASKQQLTTSGSSPDVHPDGTSVLYYAGSPADLYQVPTSGGTPTVLKSTSDADQTPAWTPDGEGVAWTRVTGSGAIEVWIADPVSATPSLLAPQSTWPDGGTLHDGSEVIAVVEGFSSSDPQIVFYDVATKTRRSGSVATGTTPAISPDGTKLAYSDDMHGDPDIFVLDLTKPLGATNPLHLTQHSGFDWQPTWSPDGERLAFTTFRVTANHNDIYVMDASAPNSETPLVATTANESEPSWGIDRTESLTPAVTESLPSEPSPSPEGPTPSPSPSAVLVPAGMLAGLIRAGRRRSR